MALLQETFIAEEDQMFIKEYRIFRADGPTQRKGVAFLVSTELDVESVRVLKDRDGHYVKVRIRDRTSSISRTFASVYIEPTAVLNDRTVPDLAMGSNFIGSDLNDADSKLVRTGVYHLRNLTFNEKLEVPNKISEHPMIIGRVHMTTKRLSHNEEYRVLN